MRALFTNKKNKDYDSNTVGDSNKVEFAFKLTSLIINRFASVFSMSYIDSRSLDKVSLPEKEADRLHFVYLQSVIRVINERLTTYIEGGEIKPLGSLSGCKTFNPSRFMYIDSLISKKGVPDEDKFYFWTKLILNEIYFLEDGFYPDRSGKGKQFETVKEFLQITESELDPLWIEYTKREKYTLFDTSDVS
jgi:hypothetical protein